MKLYKTKIGRIFNFIKNEGKFKRLLDELEDSHNELIKERAKTKELNKRLDGLENITSQTYEENQKLIEWIRNILDTVGTMEVREKRNFQIPVYLEKEYKAYNTNYMGIFEKERITIPEITIVKMG